MGMYGSRVLKSTETAKQISKFDLRISWTSADSLTARTMRDKTESVQELGKELGSIQPPGVEMEKKTWSSIHLDKLWQIVATSLWPHWNHVGNHRQTALFKFC